MRTLRDYACRDITRLVPGTKVIRVQQYGDDTRITLRTVQRVFQRAPISDSADVPEAWWRIEYGGADVWYASDAGVLPYGSGKYNEINYLIVLEDLEG